MYEGQPPLTHFGGPQRQVREYPEPMKRTLTTGPSASANELRERAHRLIPAGAHTYSKGDDQFSSNTPAFIESGSGCVVVDSDGREFLDWGMGLRSVILGHAYERVIEAVAAELPKGSNFTRPSPIELRLAERIVELIPSAEMVKLANDRGGAPRAGGHRP